ncbi:hypothetical protein SAMN05216455_107244 [Segatella bryantii]|nr:hypothetical protein SAMN05216455_107244 [Segatella bryantii]
MDKAAISAKNRFFSVKSHIFYTKSRPTPLLVTVPATALPPAPTQLSPRLPVPYGIVGCTGQHGAVGLGGSDAQQRTALAGG